MKFVQQISTLFLSLFIAHAAFAGEPAVTAKPGKPDQQQMQPPGKGRFMAQLKKELSLTEEQVQQIEKIHQQGRQQNIESRKKAASGEFQALMSLAPDSKAYDDTVKKMAATAAANASERVTRMAETRKQVFAVLNAEQKAKFLELSKDRPPQGGRIRAKGEKPAVE